MRILIPVDYQIYHDPPAEIIKEIWEEQGGGIFRTKVKKYKLVSNPDHRIKLGLSIKGGRYYERSITPTQWEEYINSKEPRLFSYAEDHATKEVKYYFYIYGSQFYYSEIYVIPEEIPLVLKKEILSKKERLEKELAKIKAEAELEGYKRQPIPQDVQIFVWNRDGGKCVNCGSNENLEFDHIIPISKGGSNTARNIQLLCQNCNRLKGNSVGG